MKRASFVHLIFAAAVGMASCTEKAPRVFDLSPDERAQAQLERYREILCSAPCGWLVTVGTQDVGAAGGAYRFRMTFKPNNRVTMYADVDAATSSTPKESSYRLKQMQYPTLMFDTYSYIHLPDDPGAPIPGATQGMGLLSDSDVNLMEDANENKNEFRGVGRKRQCPFIFTKATPEDTLAIAQGAFLTAKETAAARWESVKYPTVATTKMHLQMTVGKRLSSFTYADENSEVQTVFIPSYAALDASSIRLITPFKHGDVEFDQITWNGTEHTVSINGEPHLVYDNRQPSYPLSFGPGKTYNTLTVDKSVLNSAGGSVMLPPFLGVYDKMYSEAIAGANVFIRSFTLIFMRNEQYEEQMHLNVAFSGSSSGAANRTGEALFNVNREADAMYFTSYRLPDTEAGRNMDTIAHALAGSLIAYLLHSGSADSAGVGSNKTLIEPSGNKFKADWTINNVTGLTQALGCLRKTDDPLSYIPGVLGKQE